MSAFWDLRSSLTYLWRKYEYMYLAVFLAFSIFQKSTLIMINTQYIYQVFHMVKYSKTVTLGVRERGGGGADAKRRTLLSLRRAFSRGDVD